MRSRHACTPRTPRTFLPQAGRLTRLVLPAGVRVDAGVEEGDEIGLAYDPMIAKLIAHGSDRDDAIARLARALDATEIEGVTTNLPFLRWLVRHPAFLAGSLSTAFLVDHAPLSASPLRPLPRRSQRRGGSTGPRRLRSRHRTSTRPRRPPGPMRTGRSPLPCRERCSRSTSPWATPSRPSSALVVLEAMKMEMPVLAPFAATVTAVHVAAGDQVAAGALLVELG